jgi:hypothetical protein
MNQIAPRQIKRYGWVRDLPDHRDYIFSAPLAVQSALPAKVDLRRQCPAVYDQGQLRRCPGRSYPRACSSTTTSG